MENSHANTIIETPPSSPIPVEDSDSLREEIDIFTGTDDLLPLGFESDDYDSEGDIYFLKELLVNDSIPIPESESFYFDDPSFPRPPPEPPDVEFFFDFEPNSEKVISDELNEDERFDPGGKDLAKITKKWSKPDKTEQEIVKSAQKPDPKTFLYTNQKLKSLAKANFN
nr:hypothetical protein [Tanacetum cinerariifolium]